MDKELFKKILFFLLLSFSISLAVIYTHNFINLKVTDYVDLEDNVFAVDTLEESSVNALLLERNQDEIYTFYVESSNRNDLIFIYDDAQTEYNYYLDDQLKRQNNSEALFGYSDEIAYEVFDIEKEGYNPVDGGFIAKVQIERQNYNNASPILLLGTKDIIREYLSVRTIYNTLMMVFFLIILLISIILYLKDGTTYILITILISMVSVFKCIVSGELPVLSNLFGVSVTNFYFYEGLTNAVNYFLYQILLYKLYQIKIRNVYVALYACLSLLLMIDYLLRENIYSFLILYVIGFLVISAFQIWGCIKNKRYSMIILTTYSVFAGFNLYRILIGIGYLQRGYISSIINGPQLGSIIYILGFLIAVIMTYFKKMEQFEKNQEEFARVALLRGIGHDLKLPLSVIKINNQMLEKYRMPYEDQKEYTNSSIEATQELENMANKINSYLNIERGVDGNRTTSVKDSFEKLEKHYKIFRDRGYIFKVVCDVRDYELNIEPIQFDRILYNLVDNAFKYNKMNGEVFVEYKIMDKELVIEVADTGIGMKQEYFDKIFEPFYRIEKSRTEEGLGLGLSIVKGILKSIKGSIAVESKEDVGTKIRVFIPKSI